MSEKKDKKKYTRLTGFRVIILLIFFILALRLADIQIINGETFRNNAESKGEKQILELAPRGDILDRYNKKLATDLQSFNITYSNYDSSATNSQINNGLLQTLSILSKNDDLSKLSTQAFPVIYQFNNFAFNFSAKTYPLRIKLANNFDKNNNIPLTPLVVNSSSSVNDSNLAKRAKDIFYYLADKYTASETKSKSTTKNSDNQIVINYTLRNGITIPTMQKLIALRLAIQGTKFSQYRTVYIANNIKRETAMAMFAKSDELNGITCEISPMRYYPNGQIGSAFLGYLGKIDETQADKFTNLGYDISRELVGKMGLEKVLENNNDMNIKLRGEPGFKYVNVDKFGKILKQTALLDPIPGDTVVSTIDLDLQRVTENSLDSNMKKIQRSVSDAKYTNANRGAAIVVDVRNGEVLALASRPGFDPNWFSATGSISDDISKLVFPTDMKDPFDKQPKRMFNYATMGAGPPGSTFKPFVAISALQEGDITPSTNIVDRGVYTVVKGFKGACWKWNEYHSTHGNVNLAKALEVSCNYFFFEVGRRLGYTNFENWAYKFGLASNPKTGEKPNTGIEIDEKLGEVSSPYNYKATNINQIMKDEVIDYLKELKHGNYTITKGTQEYKLIKDMFMNGNYDEAKLNSIGILNSLSLRHIKNQINQFNSQANSVGQLLNASIGQGTTLLTPIQMVSYISTLVNGGNRYKLHLVKEVLNPNGTVKKEFQPEILNHVDLLPKNVDAVKEGMKKVTEEGGTASTAFVGMKIQTGGKTGSASVSKGQERHGRAAYGWYVGFAPMDHPQIAVCVVIYDAGHGGSAAPVARAIYDQYFKAKTKPKQSVKNDSAKQSID